MPDGKQCKDCDDCCYHNVAWPKECEWSTYIAEIGEPPDGGECLLLTIV